MESAVYFLTAAPSTLQGGMQPGYSVFTIETDAQITSPVSNGVYYGFSIRVLDVNPSGATTVWNLGGMQDNTADTNFGSTLTVLQTSGSTLPRTDCYPQASVDANDPTVLRVTLRSSSGNSCTIATGDVMQLTVPWTVLVPIPLRYTTIKLQTSAYTATITNGVYTYTPDANIAASDLALPYSTSERALQVNQLYFWFAAPSTTVVGEQPLFWRFWFTPGITLRSIAGSLATILIESNNPIFVANAPDLTFAVGSCTKSTAKTTTFDTTRGDSEVRSTLTISLAPVECVLPANVPVRFDVPQGYIAPLRKSDRISTYLATSQEPSVAWPTGFLFAGSSTVKSFDAVIPSTTLTLSTPSIVFAFTLNKALVDGDKIFIGSLFGVIRPFQSNVAISFSPSCTGTATSSPFMITITPDTGCFANMNAGSSLNMTIPQDAWMPNQPAGTPILFSLRTSKDTADMLFEAYTVTEGCNLGSISPASISSAVATRELLANFSVGQRAELVSFMTVISPDSTGTWACQDLDPFVWLFKIQEAAETRTITSPAAQTVFITNFGLMPTTPVFVIAITYPLKRNLLDLMMPAYPGLPALANIAFVVRIERMLSSGKVFNAANPISFQVLGLKNEITNVYVFSAGNDAAVAVQGNVGNWSQTKSGNLMVYCTFGPVFIGVQRLVDAGSNSDGAWFGLLALIALPLLCLCLLAFLAWHFWQKKAACPCACDFPCPMQQGCTMAPQDFPFPPAYPAPYPPPYW